MPISTCPTEQELAALLGGDQHSAAAAHLESCSRCRARLEQLAAGDATWDVALDALAQPHSSTPELAAAMAALKTAAHDNEPLTTPDLPPGFLMPPHEPGHLGHVGSFEVYEEVGRGEMGIVLKAFDEKLQRVVALKVMSPRLAGHATSRKRFIREGRAAAAVCHEHVVTIHAVDEDALLPYIVMQFVGGQSLQQRLERSGPLTVPEILRIGMQTAQGLAAAHAQGLVHRDIKPANILLENGVERVKLTDFGLARAVDDASLTRTGVIAGTPLFMAPEQARGESVDHRADLFSLGCVLYSLATGRSPFRAATTLAVLRRICDDEPRPIRELNPEIPEWLAQVILRLLAKNPAQRYASASELADVLAGCLAHVQRPGSVPLPVAIAPPAPIASKMTLPPETTPEAHRRSWLLNTPAGIAVLVLAAITPFVMVLLCAGISVFAYWLDSSSAPERRAEQATLVPDRSRVTVSAAQLAQLGRLLEIAQEELRLSQERLAAGNIAPLEHTKSEVILAVAQARYYKAAGQDEPRLEALRRNIQLHEQLLRIADERVKANVASPTERLDAEGALTEAKLELQAAEQEIAGR
jgi:serine/threonine protein kinase